MSIANEKHVAGVFNDEEVLRDSTRVSRGPEWRLIGSVERKARCGSEEAGSRGYR
jgi:hypothetical protein